MSIKKYTNFEKINQKTTNEGNFIEDKDFKIVSKGEVEEADFGDCAYDVMEVSVYDINNNVLPQASGNNVAYIKTGDIKNYVYNTSNTAGKKELAIDVEKLLNNLGFYNGILKININFVRSRVGNENEMRRVWVQEISPSRKEVRILPLKTSNDLVNDLNKRDLNNLSNLNKDFKYYKRAIYDSLHSFENIALDTINSSLETQFGKDFFNTIKNDFGIKNFDVFKRKIYDDFKESVTYYLENKYYDIKQSNFGQPSEIRFVNCDQYDFSMIIGEMEKILFDCIEHNSYFLKRRSIQITKIPKEFQIVELAKTTQNNVTAFQTPTKEGTVKFPPIDPPIIVPQQITLPTKPGVFEYHVKNKNSAKSIVVKFTDASGETVQKTISPGKSIKICALENSVSPNNLQTTFAPDDEKSTLSRKFAAPTMDFEITKFAVCNYIDIGELSPSPIPLPTMPPKVTVQTPPVVTTQPVPPTRVTTTQTTGGGGITREEAAASTNQIRVATGTAISTATAAGMSQELPSALQPRTRTDVRQTTITGPVID